MTKWTVARFPSGAWTTGGEPSDREYINCAVFVVEAKDRTTAIKKAQVKRKAQAKKASDV